jgi:hypothetical protein
MMKPVPIRVILSSVVSEVPDLGRLEFELGAWFEGACGFALELALSQMREHGLGPFGRAELQSKVQSPKSKVQGLK